MDHGLMNGMFWAGVLISAIPVIVTVAAVAYVWRASRAERIREATDGGREETLP